MRASERERHQDCVRPIRGRRLGQEVINVMEIMGLQGRKKDTGGVGGLVFKAYGLAHV